MFSFVMPLLRPAMTRESVMWLCIMLCITNSCWSSRHHCHHHHYHHHCLHLPTVALSVNLALFWLAKRSAGASSQTANFGIQESRTWNLATHQTAPCKSQWAIKSILEDIMPSHEAPLPFHTSLEQKWSLCYFTALYSPLLSSSLPDVTLLSSLRILRVAFDNDQDMITACMICAWQIKWAIILLIKDEMVYIEYVKCDVKLSKYIKPLIIESVHLGQLQVDGQQIQILQCESKPPGASKWKKHADVIVVYQPHKPGNTTSMLGCAKVHDSRKQRFAWPKTEG